MKLTGKCKEDFEKWYMQWVFNEKTFLSLRFSSEQILENWNSLHQSEKYGVYVDFFDSVGIKLSIRNISDAYWFVINNVNTKGKKDRHEGKYMSRAEARTAAIEKANEIYNSKG
jgi:hypothetical protein